MKKLLFVLLMAVVLAGFVSAAVAHPPWDVSPETVVLAEYDVHEGIVTLPTDIAFTMPATVDKAISLLSDNLALISDKITVKPHFRMINFMKAECFCGSCLGYHLRL